jgi:hypothetical protein
VRFVQTLFLGASVAIKLNIAGADCAKLRLSPHL